MQYRVYDTQYASRLYCVDDLEIQFSNHEAIVSPEVAYRMDRFGKGDFQIEKLVTPYNPDSWKRDRRLIWSCNYASANGFGSVAENTVKHLMQQGTHVENPGAVSGNLIMGGDMVDEEVKASLKTKIYPDCLEIQHCQPPALRFDITDRIWTYTMFETTHTPRMWIENLNKVEHILVPTSWLVASWQDQGVTRPISVFGHGIDPEVYSYIERPEREIYTFLHLGQLSLRKGTDLVYIAFTREFQGQADVKLILKNTYPFFPVPLNTPNVEYIHATYSKDQMRSLMERADCFVFPSRGEGFGLPPLEAMASGLPTIMTNWGGMMDFGSKEDTLLLDYKMVRALEFDQIYEGNLDKYENTGLWAEAEINQLREYMRWCYDHRSEAKVMGKKAAERVARDWTWSKKVSELVTLLDQYI